MTRRRLRLRQNAQHEDPERSNLGVRALLAQTRPRNTRRMLSRVQATGFGAPPGNMRMLIVKHEEWARASALEKVGRSLARRSGIRARETLTSLTGTRRAGEGEAVCACSPCVTPGPEEPCFFLALTCEEETASGTTLCQYSRSADRVASSCR